MVSVILPVRNGAEFVAEAVASVLDQTLHDFELLVIDDGSQDATPTILTRLAEVNPRLRIIAQPPLGLVAALNRGLREARGHYVARMDADDVAASDRFARQVAKLAAHPEVAGLGSACRVIDRNGTVLGYRCPPTDPAEIRRALSRGNCMIHPTMMLRRDLVLRAGGYRAAFRLCEDFDLWLRLSEHHDLLNLPEPVLDYRAHAGQSNWQDLEQRALSELGAVAAAACRQAGLPDPVNDGAVIDREFLRSVGLSETAITTRVVACALGAAKDAIAARHSVAARAAVGLLLRQPGLSVRTRLHAWLLLLRSRIR